MQLRAVFIGQAHSTGSGWMRAVETKHAFVMKHTELLGGSKAHIRLDAE